MEIVADKEETDTIVVWLLCRFGDGKAFCSVPKLLKHEETHQQNTVSRQRDKAKEMDVCQDDEICNNNSGGSSYGDLSLPPTSPSSLSFDGSQATTENSESSNSSSSVVAVREVDVSSTAAATTTIATIPFEATHENSEKEGSSTSIFYDFVPASPTEFQVPEFLSLCQSNENIVLTGDTSESNKTVEKDIIPINHISSSSSDISSSSKNRDNFSNLQLDHVETLQSSTVAEDDNIETIDLTDESVQCSTTKNDDKGRESTTQRKTCTPNTVPPLSDNAIEIDLTLENDSNDKNSEDGQLNSSDCEPQSSKSSDVDGNVDNDVKSESEADLIVPKNTHECKECQKKGQVQSFSKKVQLLAHLKSEHPTPRKRSGRQKRKINKVYTTPTTHECELCGVNFTSLFNLITHCACVHDKSMGTRKKKKINYNVDAQETISEETVQPKNKYSSPGRPSMRPKICKCHICDIGFVTVKSLEIHVRSKHPSNL